MKLLLINPQNQYRIGFSLSVTSRYPPLSLGILGALTPDHWDVSILDENFEKFEDVEDKSADLVGITSFSPNTHTPTRLQLISAKETSRWYMEATTLRWCLKRPLNM